MYFRNFLQKSRIQMPFDMTHLSFFASTCVYEIFHIGMSNKGFFLFQKHIHTFSWCDASWNHHSLVTNWKINCLIKESLFFASWFCTNLKHQPCFSWFIYCARQRNEWLIMVIFHEIWRDHISLFLCSFLSRRLK